MPIKAINYASNLELSVARALSVARFFIDRKGYESSRVGVAGFGSNRPIASNDTPTGREKNRRVEINVVERTTAPSREVINMGLGRRREITNYGR